MEYPLVLAFSFAPTSSAVAVFRGSERVRVETVLHDLRELAKARRAESQRELRARAVREFLFATGLTPGALGAIAVRADTLLAVDSGTYRVDGGLIRAADSGFASMAAQVAHDLGAEWQCPAFAVDPSGSDERRAMHSADGEAGARAMFAMKAAARRHARAVERPIEVLRLVLVHLGAAVSVCVHSGGRIGEIHEAIGEQAVARGLSLALDGVEAGDGRASAIVNAAANRIAQDIGGLATVLEGEVDAVVVTGELERAGSVLAEICRRVEWIAPVFLYRAEDELRALAHGAVAVLRGDEPLKRYA